MNSHRRILLKGTVAVGTVGAALSAGLLTPKMVLATWPKPAFEAKDVNTALSAAFGDSNTTESSKIKLGAPPIAENGASVQISVTSGIANTKSISIAVPGNNSPLTSTFKFGSNAEGFIATRIKMAKTSDVIAIVKANGKLYSTKQQVKVTIGGCGG